MRWTENSPEEMDTLQATESDSVVRSGYSHFDKLNLLWNERRFLLRMAAWGFVCSVLLSLAMPVRYESTTRLMPPDSTGDSLAMLSAVADKAGLPGSLAGSFLGLKSSADLLIGILNSNTLQDRLITRYNLAKVYGATFPEDIRQKLAEHTAIGQDRKSGIIAITVTEHDPKLAVALANSYVDELNALSSQLSTSSARRERVFLEERLTQVSKDLEKAQIELSQFSSKNATFNPLEQSRAMITSVAELQGRMIAAQAQLEGVRAIYSDNSVKVRALRAEITRLQQEIERMGGKPGADLNADASSELYPSIRQLPLLGVTYADLFRRAKIEEAVYEALTRQYELAKVQEAKEIPAIRVLDSAELPQKKSFPPRTVITLFGIVLSFAFAVLWTLVSGVWETTDPEHPGKLLAGRIWDSISSPVQKRMASANGWVAAAKTPLRRNGADEKSTRS
ncbi:MAG TPA: GNVR domain-containing protein [Candidatus Angelobacter sp.]|nr:GNVR domain-containing protein [Candidatus Angelobacter sp.]